MSTVSNSDTVLIFLWKGLTKWKCYYKIRINEKLKNNTGQRYRLK